MPELPPDWQRRMVDMIRGASELDSAWFAGGPVCTPMEQIGIYRTQYRLRLVDAVREETPGLCALLGEEATALFEAYLADHPSRSFTLNRVADPLADWLERRGAPVELVDMARLDHAVQAGFEAAEGRPLDVALLGTLPPLELAPHVRLLRLRTDVHLLRSAVLGGGERPPVRRADVPLVVFRREHKMRHWAAGEALWTLLRALEQGLGVAEALGLAVERAGLPEERLAEVVQGWFTDLAERGLVQVPEP